MFESESLIQRTVVKYFKMKDECLFWHTPNGELRTKGTGRKLKTMGVLPGVPDLFFAHPKMPWSAGLFVELKSKKGRLTDNQKDVAVKLDANNYIVAVCDSSDYCIDLVNAYLNVNCENDWNEFLRRFE